MNKFNLFLKSKFSTSYSSDYPTFLNSELQYMTVKLLLIHILLII